MPRAYVGLGSNLGEREATIRAALATLDRTAGIDVVTVSTLVETDPIGIVDQPRFLNGVAVLETELPARALLRLLLDTELRFGRDRASVPLHGPRTLDLDLLLYGDAVLDEEGLRVPHPRLHERRFVLGPLAEVAPGLEVPEMGTVEALLARLH